MKSEEKLPLVSIVITNYNYGKYLRESIESAVKQTYKNTEIILIDDASTDDSRKVWEQFSDKIRVIEHKINKGIVFSRNEALNEVKGEYITFLDADDYFEADYVDKMMKVSYDMNADVVYPNWHLFGENIDMHEMNFNKKFIARDLMLQNIHVSPSSLVKISSIKDHKFVSERVAEDWDFFIGLALDGVNFCGSDAWINYRQKSGSRGSKNGEIFDTKIFIKILDKWRKKYKSKVIRNEDFLFNKLEVSIRVRDDFARELSEVRRNYEKENLLLKNDLNTFKNNQTKINDDISRILNSRSYKIGLKITNTIKFPKKILKRVMSEKGGKK